jgi:hypothetical protein
MKRQASMRDFNPSCHQKQTRKSSTKARLEVARKLLVVDNNVSPLDRSLLYRLLGARSHCSGARSPPPQAADYPQYPVGHR